MNKKVKVSLLLLVLGVFVLSACSGGAATASQGWPGVSVDEAEEMVYISSGPTVSAINAENGSLIWTYPEKPSAAVGFYAAPTVADAVLVVGDYATKIHAIDLATGNPQWTFNDAKDRYVGSILFDGETLYAPASDYFVYALDLSGNLKWKFNTHQANWSAPVADEDTVYIASMDHFVYALDKETGMPRWESLMEGAMSSSPLLVDGTLYVSTLNSDVVSLDAKSGSVNWTTNLGELLWGSPVAHEGMIYASGADGTLFGLDAEDGSKAWTVSLGSPITGSPALYAEGMVVVTEAKDVVALDFDGSKLWTRNITDERGSLHGSPIIMGEKIIMGVTQGSESLLVAFDLGGNELWSYYPEK
ncbi:MAG: PQQ-like beta-propeller repeat protein [Anaerolineaceae bacterium]|nr:PQQ-like beta-propeller repeat protein [Anaerolineaceae bacterium]